MKKMMIALAGIAAVMMLASCQKEVEIDGDVSLEQPTTYDYRLKVNGTVTKTVYEKKEKEEKYVPGVGNLVYEWDSVKEESERFYAKDWQGNVTWENDPDSKSNVKKYTLTITDDSKEFPTTMKIEYYDGKYSVADKRYSPSYSHSDEYLGVLAASPEKQTFKLATHYSSKDKDDDDYKIGDTYTDYSYDLTFTR